MAQKDIWLTITKSRPLPGCEIDMDGCEFYFVDAFVPLDKNLGADSIPNAISKVKSALLEDKLELAEVIQCVKFLPEEWIDQTETDESLHDLATKALEAMMWCSALSAPRRFKSFTTTSILFKKPTNN